MFVTELEIEPGAEQKQEPYPLSQIVTLNWEWISAYKISQDA